MDRDPMLKERPYSLDVNIMPDSCANDMRLDMLIGEPLVFGFDKIDEMAEHYYQFLIKEEIIKKDENSKNNE